jgi:6-pyruvoyltetrahydropterin/6-carboxytetrahydropterin synthase
MKLTREIRCSPGNGDGTRPLNTWAGTGGADLSKPFWLLHATVEGAIDPQTGYLCDIKQLDALLRKRVYLELSRRPQETGVESLNGVIGAMLRAFEVGAANCPASAMLFSIELAVSPYTRFTVFARERDMVFMTRSFEFCASHRLAVAGFSDEENRRLFGKCSNPHGHGHNYVVEVTVRGASNRPTGGDIELPRLDRVVNETVIDRYDHKNLNVECPEFARVNPTVENIARMIFERLETALLPAKLSNVRVWETPKTFADCDGTDA